MKRQNQEGEHVRKIVTYLSCDLDQTIGIGGGIQPPRTVLGEVIPRPEFLTIDAVFCAQAHHRMISLVPEPRFDPPQHDLLTDPIHHPAPLASPTLEVRR